jgi:hypothetical protein
VKIKIDVLVVYCKVAVEKDIQCDQKENKSEQTLHISGHVVAEFYASKLS